MGSVICYIFSCWVDVVPVIITSAFTFAFGFATSLAVF